MKNVFVIGSKGIPSNYGGFETFVEKLTEYNDVNHTEIKYHVSCLSNNDQEYEHNNARCFNVKVPNIGPAKAVYYDIVALDHVLKYIENNKIEDAIIYVLACRIGPFIGHFKKKMEKLNVKLFVNPDGHEWKRAKWNWLIRKYWKYSEKLMVKHADLLVCDSITIEEYIKTRYAKFQPNTTFIAYGADVSKSPLVETDQKVVDWFQQFSIAFDQYYLIVGRFVPENNYETMISEFMNSNSQKDLVIITNVEKNKFYNHLKNKTGFESDPRVKFVGTVYDQDLLKFIREKAFAYLHGHEVGGTNPSLLEALASTKLNLLLDVGFNSEVAKDHAIYWSKTASSKGVSLKQQIHRVEENQDVISQLNAQQVIIDHYSWDKIVNDYSHFFLSE